MRKLLLFVIFLSACSSNLTLPNVRTAFKNLPMTNARTTTNGAVPALIFDECSVYVYPTVDEANLRHKTFDEVTKGLGRLDTNVIHKNVTLSCELPPNKAEPYKKALESL